MVEAQESVAESRVLRFDYSKILSLITENRDDIGAGVDSNKFDSIIKEVENLHHHVRKPREQVADAEALLNLTSTLTAAVEFYTRGSVTQSEFVSCLLRKFGQSGKRGTSDCSHDFLFWRHLGLYVSPIFKNVRGCRTMLGPMKTEVKQRKVAVRRRYAKPVENVQPEQLNGTFAEEKTETDKNMVTIFEILTKKKAVKIEHLLLNRMSFAQTVENLFALSFLVKDGRVEIVVDEMGSHIVSPRNYPTASSVRSGEVKYTAFIFRFDFKDWKLMKEQVPEGQELMPNRVDRLISGCKAETEFVRMHNQI